MAHKIQPHIETILRAAKCVDGDLFLQGHLERKDYAAVNKVLELSGFKWNKKQKCHVAIKGSASETLAAALDDGEIVDPKKEWDFFETPEDVADRMAKFLGIKSTDHVLEPSAGAGRLVDAAFRHGASFQNTLAIEAWAENREILKSKCHVATETDFLKVDPASSRSVDKIIMNPPFSGGQDIAHCLHAYAMLKPGGRMACITGPSWQYRTDKKHAAFKAWFESLDDAGCEELPAGTFKDSGTNVRSLLLTIVKESSHA